ncbi:MAG: 5' nucleotidase, deoxy (Pyrimidine), cytosolic type C protein (NT5C) [Pelotomaculum sp. PtaB.Bin013]|uniref:Nucleotidase n=1 Tax=Pelotomaculum isophthalicicum JI TaxID=947010 RepID=A0A9X4JV78_9FIRM|nr:hypothetical protein [Pelotomaculum isophthalicicum]MDF9406912.1 hypothetical protein [Pelotomaculum isophthalicicum JI]OPX91039.1 MAG: 5' nucleotidase, deoxy (Pyrimidine), cytosolic type C protein (NT5C) [Pelotomaculum sp. PtaB.Bin013]
MRVGVDIDGVLADSLPLWVRELNRYFNKNKQVEEIHLYNIIQTFEITATELKAFIEQKGRFLMSAACPVKGAAHYLSMIKKYHHICIVTARREAYKQETQAWLRRHGMLYDELVLLGSYKKDETCLEKGLDVMVEDTLEVGLELSAAGIPVILMDAPYNRGNLPGLIYRKHSWFEIYRALVIESQQLMTSCNNKFDLTDCK